MNRLKSISVVIIIFIAAIQPSLAQEKSDSAAQAEMMAKMIELAEPSAEHEMLGELEGEWNFETKMWMSRDDDALVFPGTVSIKMILGGRFLHGEFKTDSGIMDGGGLFIMGFDRRLEKFTYVGFDSWGTYSVSAEGTYNEETNSITMYGEEFDPVFDSTQKYDIVVTYISDDSWRFEVYFYDEAYTEGNGKFKMVEVNYTRTR